MKNLVCKKCWIKYLHRLIYNLYILYIEIKTFESIIYATLNYWNWNYLNNNLLIILNNLLTLFKFEPLVCDMMSQDVGLSKVLRSRNFGSVDIPGISGVRIFPEFRYFNN